MSNEFFVKRHRSPYTSVLSLLVLLSAVIVMGAACNNATDDTIIDNQNDNVVPGTGANVDVDATVDDEQARAAVISSYETQINALEGDIAELNTRLENAGAEVSAETRTAWQNTRAELQVDLQNARQELQELREATQEQWQELKTQTAIGINALSEAVVEAGLWMDAAVDVEGNATTTN